MSTKVSQHWNTIQAKLFPILEEELLPLTDNHYRLITVIEFVRVEDFIPYYQGVVGAPPCDRRAIARAFIAKKIYNIERTNHLIDRLICDPVMRRLCGWERRREVPSESTFSRAFHEFAQSHLPARIHEAFIKANHADRLIGHNSRDATAIEARERAVQKPQPTTVPPKDKKKRGRPKKGEVRVKEPESEELKRLQRQPKMSLAQMLDDLPKQCDIGVKKNSKGHRLSWKGYKLHIDTADGDIPISAILTAASTHDSQVAIPLAVMTKQHVTHCYDLMDAAYDAKEIRHYCQSLGHVALIDFNRRSPKDTRSFAPHEAERYKERSAAERVNSQLKDNYGGRQIRVRGADKVFTELMFGVLALAVEQTVRLLI